MHFVCKPHTKRVERFVFMAYIIYMMYRTVIYFFIFLIFIDIHYSWVGSKILSKLVFASGVILHILGFSKTLRVITRITGCLTSLGYRSATPFRTTV